jgi:hypothetical protein
MRLNFSEFLLVANASRVLNPGSVLREALSASIYPENLKT